MSLIFLYLGVVFYIFIFDVEIEYLFLYTYLTALVISPLKNIKVSNFNFKEIESHFLHILLFSALFLFLYGFQMLYYENFQINRLLFHFNSDIVPDILKNTISFYKEWTPKLFDNSLIDLICTVIFNLFLIVIKIIGLVIAIPIVVCSIIYMIFIGGFIALINSIIAVIIIALMLYPIIFANKNIMNIVDKDELKYGQFLKNYIEISKIILFFIFVAI